MTTPSKAILGGAVASSVGIIVAAAGNATPGGVLVVAGWLVFLYGIHRFGRAGA